MKIWVKLALVGSLFFHLAAEANHFGLFFGRGLRSVSDCLLSSNLITNGTFNSDVSGWTGNLGSWTSFNSGSANVSTSGVANGTNYFRQLIPTTAGKKYLLTYDFVASTWTGTAYSMGYAVNGGDDVRNDPKLTTPVFYVNPTNNINYTFTAVSGNTNIVFATENVVATTTVDNVVLREYTVNNATAASQSYGGNCEATACESGYSVVGGQCVFNYIVATGGTITQSGGYRIHTFTGSGNFNISSVPPGATIEYLIVGGGGGGSCGHGGAGGGGGGLLQGTNLTVTATNYPVVVGAGGNRGIWNASVLEMGTNGGNSSFAGFTANGGGHGGMDYNGGGNWNGAAGGSGGGGGGIAGVGQGSGGTAVAGQGYAGGYGLATANGAGGGGGGAGGPGQNSNVEGYNVAGTGGPGLPSTITGSTLYYAGGGGGGVDSNGRGGHGSLGGGGAGCGTRGAGNGSASADGNGSSCGGSNGRPGDGINGKGGGGGGSGATGDGAGAGGSGVVIIRYPYL